MKTTITTDRRSWVLAVLIVALLTGCDAIFKVNNPNQLAEDDLASPEAAAALVNGAEASLARALAQLVLPLSVAGDELQSIGSLDFGLRLDQGSLSNPGNQVTNGAFSFVAEARFMADEAIGRLEAFEADGRLRDDRHLARAYLYGGIVYAAIADGYDDFVISDRREAAPPIGPEHMHELYDRAIEYLDRGLVAARTAGSDGLELAILAQRARTYHARAVWHAVRGGPGPLVSSVEAVADAEAALGLLPSPDWRLEFGYSAGTVGTALGSQVNVRQEYRISDLYGVPTADNRRVERVRLVDPLSGEPDAALGEAIDAFVSAGRYPSLIAVSARELRLIVAEDALAHGAESAAIREINRVRDLTGRVEYDGSIDVGELLRHERRVNLLLQGRRLADHYRFGERAPTWLDSSDAVQRPGTFFPIAEVERLSNCHIAGTCS